MLRSKTTTLSAQSYPEKGSFENEMWSLHKPSTQSWKKKVHGQPCNSIPITFIKYLPEFFCLRVSKSLAVGCVAGDKVILQTSNSELDGTVHERNVGYMHKNKLQIGELSPILSVQYNASQMHETSETF